MENKDMLMLDPCYHCGIRTIDCHGHCSAKDNFIKMKEEFEKNTTHIPVESTFLKNINNDTNKGDTIMNKDYLNKDPATGKYLAIDGTEFKTQDARAKHDIEEVRLKCFDSDGELVKNPIKNSDMVYFVPIITLEQLQAFQHMCVDTGFYNEEDALNQTGGIYFYHYSSGISARNWDFISFELIDSIFHIINRGTKDAQDQ